MHMNLQFACVERAAAVLVEQLEDAAHFCQLRFREVHNFATNPVRSLQKAVPQIIPKLGGARREIISLKIHRLQEGCFSTIQFQEGNTRIMTNKHACAETQLLTARARTLGADIMGFLSMNAHYLVFELGRQGRKRSDGRAHRAVRFQEPSKLILHDGQNIKQSICEVRNCSPAWHGEQ